MLLDKMVDLKLLLLPKVIITYIKILEKSCSKVIAKRIEIKEIKRGQNNAKQAKHNVSRIGLAIL